MQYKVAKGGAIYSFEYRHHDGVCVACCHSAHVRTELQVYTSRGNFAAPAGVNSHRRKASNTGFAFVHCVAGQFFFRNERPTGEDIRLKHGRYNLHVSGLMGLREKEWTWRGAHGIDETRVTRT